MTAVSPDPVTSVTSSVANYRIFPANQSADALERDVLEQWRAEQLFERTQRESAGRPEFVFFEGPPTANGRPGIHHVFARTVKDLFCRHRAMKGFHVTRKAGWDTHGLPVEIEVEKQLGISGKQDIEKYGVELFNTMCRESVFKYRADWEQLSERIAYWLDYNDPYVTYTNDYVESVWWALKTLYEKGRLYRGHKILPYCARCGTALSSHEVAQGYKTVKDPSVYIALDLVGDTNGSANASGRRRIIVWTTTPWTLVSNVALAVNPELEYVELRKRTGDGSETIVLAGSRAGGVLGADYQDRWETVRTMPGAALVGMRYRRPLDWVEYGEGVHEIIVGESFVTADDGSGVVHMAPAFGADDYAAGQRNGLAFLQPVDARGRFPETLPLVGGKFVKDGDAEIIEELKRRGVLWKAQQFEHAYPHCWRCDTPLLYYARSSWFVRTTDFKDGMIARNDRVDWHPPEVGAGRFGEWLKNNIDWAISRDRYWGTPLPIWINDEDPTEIEVIGSYAELSERLGTTLNDDFDPHKPYVDRHTWPAKSGKGTMRRVPEVIDTWFDSGSMPFAQWHYPFENRDTFERHYPGDFIAEGVDQTRGWFYSLLAIATGLGDALPRNAIEGGAAPYGSVVVNDLVLAKDGSKMSKSRGNTVDPWTVIQTHGVDAIRLFLIASSQVWMPRRFDEDAIRETVGRFLVTFKNAYSGIFALYANFGWTPSADDPPVAERPAIDRWILSRLTSVEQECDALLHRFDATLAVRAAMDFFTDEVSNWYIRLTRHRFYDVDAADNRAAFATLHEVLTVACRLLAPFAPFLTDWVHRELTGTSVHLAPYVRSEPTPVDAELEQAMGHVRTLSTLGRAAREEAGVKVRQPLATLVCVVPDGAGAHTFGELVPLLQAELNVKKVSFASSADALVTLEAKANFRSLGKKFGKQTPLAAAAIQSFDGETLRRFERGEDLEVAVGNESHPLSPEDVTIVRRATGSYVVKEDGAYFAAIDPTITPELRREGIARELVSRVQRLRKELGFAVSDRITLSVAGDEETQETVLQFREWIAEEVLARDVHVARDGSDNRAAQQIDLEGRPVTVALTRIE